MVCIPNAVKTQELIETEDQDRPYFLFLGRMHHKKGIELLIESFTSLKHLDFDLKIAGSENEYSLTLQNNIQKMGDVRIKFIGAVRGEKKKELYRNAHAFIAPSYSEVVGMVNLEAAMMGTPVITTYQTGLLKEWSNNGGILINPNTQELTKAMEYAAKWSREHREENGLKLREFVITNYSWKTIKPLWEEIYNF